MSCILSVSGRSSLRYRLRSLKKLTTWRQMRSVKWPTWVSDFIQSDNVSFNYHLNILTERMSEIQYQNRILLRKMLQIDLKASNNVVGSKNASEKPDSNPNGLNSYNSLNRAVRITELARVADSNKSILNRLQTTRATYSTDKWNRAFDNQRKIIGNISSNGDRYCKNPYFLHSVCT